MGISQKHYNEIKADFEKDSGWLLSLHFSNKQYLVKNFLDDYPDESDISFRSTKIEWDRFSTEQFTEEHDVFKIKTSLYVEGDLIFYDQLKESNCKSISLNLYVEIPCRYVAESDFIHYLRESIEIMTEDLRDTKAFDEIVLKEFDSLIMLKPLDFGIIQGIWPFNQKGNDAQVFISGYGYFSEIDNMYRQVRYSIALAKTYFHYANRYFITEARQPFLHYPINFTSHDRRYLDYCTNAIHSMYVFWERLALLIYQYHQPKKVSAMNLSFAKLVGAISKEEQSTAIDMSWFTNFLKDYHSKLQLLRHPLVHFKLEPNGTYKGSYIPMIYNQWLGNIKDKAHLLQQENNSKALIGEIIDLAKKCQEGYEKTIQLIVDLKSPEILAAQIINSNLN